MPKFLFWNIGRNVSPKLVGDVAAERHVDIVVLAETGCDDSIFLDHLNERTDRLYYGDQGNSKRLRIFTRFPVDAHSLVRDTPWAAMRHYRMPLGSEFLVVAVHLPSKLHKKTEDQVLAATRLARQIQDAEERVGHTRTVLIGDLNMNPFEVGMVGSEGLHAVSDRRVVEAVERVVQEERRMFFYNPMWGALGDADNTPPGTYFYNSGTEVNFFWNAFDQVLIRPSLLPFFRRVTVIQAINGMSLLTDSGRPNQAAHSDHLPILADLSDIEDSANVY